MWVCRLQHRVETRVRLEGRFAGLEADGKQTGLRAGLEVRAGQDLRQSR